MPTKLQTGVTTENQVKQKAKLVTIGLNFYSDGHGTDSLQLLFAKPEETLFITRDKSGHFYVTGILPVDAFSSLSRINQVISTTTVYCIPGEVAFQMDFSTLTVVMSNLNLNVILGIVELAIFETYRKCQDIAPSILRSLLVKVT